MAEPEQPTDRINVALLPRVAQALTDTAQRTGRSKTDVVNRAILLMQFVENLQEMDSILLVRLPDGKLERVHLI